MSWNDRSFTENTDDSGAFILGLKKSATGSIGKSYIISVATTKQAIQMMETTIDFAMEFTMHVF